MKPWEVFAVTAGLGFAVGLVLLVFEGGRPLGGTLTVPGITVKGVP